MQLFLSKEEKFHIESIAVKRNNLTLQDQLLQNELNGVITEFCKRNSMNVEKVKELNLELGFVIFENEKKGEEKKSDKVTK